MGPGLQWKLLGFNPPLWDACLYTGEIHVEGAAGSPSVTTGWILFKFGTYMQ